MSEGKNKAQIENLKMQIDQLETQIRELEADEVGLNESEVKGMVENFLSKNL